MPAAAQTRLRVGTVPTVNMLPVWMADDAGLFAAHGLDVTIVPVAGGTDGLAAIAHGRLDIMNVGLSAVIAANGQGAHFRLVASAANTLSFEFFGAAGVMTAAALKGKRVGISAPHSESDVAASLALKRLDLTRADVTIVVAGGTTARLADLRAGRLAATALNEPADTVARDAHLPLLADLAEDEPWIFTGVVLDRSFLAAHRAVALAFLRAYIEGIHLALAEPARAKAALARRFPAFAPAVIDAAYADFARRVPRDAAPAPAGIANMLRTLPTLGMPVAADAAGYVDDSLIDALHHEGFFDVLQKKYGAR